MFHALLYFHSLKLVMCMRMNYYIYKGFRHVDIRYTEFLNLFIAKQWTEQVILRKNALFAIDELLN